MNQRYYSNIYWHFTGSPRVKDAERTSCTKPKDILHFAQPRAPEEALETLFAILESNKLLGTCEERISDKLKTHKFCCVTDIPLLDLPLHAQYYGKVALGFNCARIHQEFNPVLYIPSWKLPLKKHNPNHFLATQDIDSRKVDRYFVDHLKITNFSPRVGESFYQEQEWRHIGDHWFNGKSVEAVIVPRNLKERAQKFILSRNRKDFAHVTVLTWDFIEQA